MYAGNSAAGSRPASRASRDVYGETVRTAAARRTAQPPTRVGDARERARRSGEP